MFSCLIFVAVQSVALLNISGSMRTEVTFDITATSYNSSVEKNGEESLKNFLKFVMNNKFLEKLSTNYRISEMSFLRSAENESVVQVAALMNVILSSNKTKAEYYGKLRIRKQTFIQEIIQQSTVELVPSSIRFIDADQCLPEVTHDEKGEHVWNYTNTKLTQTILCPYGGGHVTRYCHDTSFKTFANWKDFNSTQCNMPPAAHNKMNRELQTIIEDLTRNSSLLDASTKLKNITSEVTNMTTQEVTLVNNILQIIVQATNTVEVQAATNILEVVSNIMDVNEDVLINAQKEGRLLNDIINTVGITAKKLSIVQNSTQSTDNIVQVTARHIGIAILRHKNNSMPQKMSVAVSSKSTEETFRFHTGSVDQTIKNEGIMITLPRNILKDALRKDVSQDVLNNVDSSSTIQFIHFNKSSLFTVADNVNKNTSKIFSVAVGDKHSVELSEDLEYTVPIFSSQSDGGLAMCVFWDFSKRNGLGDWSEDGCKTTQSSEGRVICNCNHLTNFAVLFNYGEKARKKMDDDHQLALSIISYVGCGLSLIGIFLTLLSLLLFRFLRQNIPSKILIGLCSSLGFLIVIFLALVDKQYPLWLCSTTSALLHFFILNCFSWTLVEAITLYLKVVKVTGEYPTKFVTKAIVCTFVFPATIVITFFMLQTNDYKRNAFCVISGVSFRYGLVLPVSLILAVNFSIFVMVVRTLAKQCKNKSNNKNIIGRIRIAISCCILLGLTWVFGIFSVASSALVFQYLFCIINSFQGVFIFYFNILRQSHIKKAWKDYIYRNKSTTNSRSNASSYSYALSSKSTPNKLRIVPPLGHSASIVDNAHQISSVAKSFLDFSDDEGKTVQLGVY